jgi:hypothetical protein
VKFEYFQAHLERTRMSRRQAVRHVAQIGAAAGAAGAFASLGSAALRPEPAAAQGGGQLPPEPLTDEIFDVAAVERGAWVPGPYGPGDQRGSWNEVTPQKTAAALRMLDTNAPVVTYNLGELLFNGFPAFRTTPPRLYEQRLTQSGYQPSDDFGGFRGSPEPAGPNRISGHEERFPESGTYQIATQLDNLNHVGVGAMFYNGFRGPEIARTWGTTALGNEHMGPLVTRGIALDIVGLKQAQGATGDYFTAGNGGRVLRDNYRITVDDITDALQRQGIGGPTPGDVVLFRTGWTHLVRTDPERYLMQEPGIYLREARYLGSRRPAIIGSDVWGLEVLDPEVTQGFFFPVHQLLFMRYGIRIGEGMVTEGLVEDGVFEFVYIVTPQYAAGATAGNTPPAALGQPGGRGGKKSAS